MGKTSNDPLAVIGGVLILVIMICPFCAVWDINHRLEWTFTTIWAVILAYIIVRAIKESNDKSAHALIFVEHIEQHLRQWEKDKKIKPNSLKVMCKICEKPIDEIVKEKGGKQ